MRQLVLTIIKTALILELGALLITSINSEDTDETDVTITDEVESLRTVVTTLTKELKGNDSFIHSNLSFQKY